MKGRAPASGLCRTKDAVEEEHAVFLSRLVASCKSREVFGLWKQAAKGERLPEKGPSSPGTIVSAQRG